MSSWPETLSTSHIMVIWAHLDAYRFNYFGHDSVQA